MPLAPHKDAELRKTTFQTASKEERAMAMTTLLRESAQSSAVSEGISLSVQKSIDATVETVRSRKDTWVAVRIRERVSLIETLIEDIAAIAERWVAVCCEAKGIAGDSPTVVEEWTGGPYLVLHNLQLLRRSLLDIETYGQPRIPGPVTVRPNGQVVAQVFPQTFYDRLFYSGITAEIWMEPGVTVEELPKTQAFAYQHKAHPGKVALVLGA
jgi:hypothetical protein